MCWQRAGWIEPAHLHPPAVAGQSSPLGGSTLREQSRQRVQQTLAEVAGNVSEAARRLEHQSHHLYRALRGRVNGCRAVQRLCRLR